MSLHVFLINILLATSLQIARLAVAAPSPAAAPEPLFNTLLALLNPSTVTNSSSGLNALALSHINHQLNTLSSLGSILGSGGFNFTDSIFG